MKIEMGSNRSFGIIFCLISIIFSFFVYEKNTYLFFIFLIFSIIFLLLGILDSRYLTPLNKIWFHFGLLLGKVISPVIMIIIYILFFTPTGILLRIFSRDVLDLKKNKGESYWKHVDDKKGSMRNQF